MCVCVPNQYWARVAMVMGPNLSHSKKKPVLSSGTLYLKAGMIRVMKMTIVTIMIEKFMHVDGNAEHNELLKEHSLLK